jgi:hypothetical protein
MVEWTVCRPFNGLRRSPLCGELRAAGNFLDRSVVEKVEPRREIATDSVLPQKWSPRDLYRGVLPSVRRSLPTR